MKPIIGLFGCTLLILLMAATMGGITAFRASSQTANFAVTTPVGSTSTNVTLPLAVLDDSLINITSVTSNNTADAPTGTLFISASKLLNITTLNAADTRRLTVVYWSPKLDAFIGVDIAAKWWPLFLVLAILMVCVAAMVHAWQNH